MTSSAIDKIVDGFPFPTIPSIAGVPTYETLAELHSQLNSNAASVQSNLGNGELGHLFLTVSPAVYNTLSDTPAVPPENPGPDAIIPNGATRSVIVDLRHEHTVDTQVFTTYVNTDKALKRILLAAVDEMYYRTLRHRFIGYGNVTTRQILDHLYAQYADISSSALQDNDKRLKAPYDPNQPIESIFEQIETAVEFAAAGNSPYTPVQIVNLAYELFFQTGLFLDDCRRWKRRDAAEKTWQSFKIFFSDAHKEWRESLATTSGSGYGQAHHAAILAEQQDETLTALANLATATQEDRACVANLTETNKTLTLQCTTSHAKLVTALEDVAKLTVTVADLRRKLAAKSPADAATPAESRPVHYCWTHGYLCTHNSFKCPQPAAGHDKYAKASDTKKGSTKNKPE